MRRNPVTLLSVVFAIMAVPLIVFVISCSSHCGSSSIEPQPPAPQVASDEHDTKKTQLTKSQVLGMADTFAQERREKYENFDLAFYPDREAKYDAGSWYVSYIRVPNRWPGDHFSIYVNDKTGEMNYIGGR